MHIAAQRGKGENSVQIDHLHLTGEINGAHNKLDAGDPEPATPCAFSSNSGRGYGFVGGGAGIQASRSLLGRDRHAECNAV